MANETYDIYGPTDTNRTYELYGPTDTNGTYAATATVPELHSKVKVPKKAPLLLFFPSRLRRKHRQLTDLD